MKLRTLFATITFAFAASFSVAGQTTGTTNDSKALDSIADDLKSVSRSLTTFNKRLDTFLAGLDKYKGVQLTERQQRLLFGYEVLNQTEQLAATIRKSLADTVEREAGVRRRLGELQLALRPASIDRAFQTLGTTETDELRDGRRRTLEEERTVLTTLVTDLAASRLRLSENLRQAETFAESFRQSLFSDLSTEIRRP